MAVAEAITSGFARSLPCPNSAADFFVSSPGTVTSPSKDGAPVNHSWPMPKYVD